MILRRVPFNCTEQFKKLFHTSTTLAHYIRNEWFSKELCSTILISSRSYPIYRDSRHTPQKMNDSEQSSAQPYSPIQEIIPYTKIHSTLHKKWLILSTVLFKYSEQSKKLSHTLTFIPHYVKYYWFSPQMCSAYCDIFKKLSHSQTHSTLHKKRMILRSVLFNHSDQFRNYLINSDSLHIT